MKLRSAKLRWRIPDEFDETYEEYNDLQKTQGLDLEKYKGRNATLYVYSVRNDPSGEEGVTANLVLLPQPADCSRCLLCAKRRFFANDHRTAGRKHTGIMLIVKRAIFFGFGFRKNCLFLLKPGDRVK